MHLSATALSTVLRLLSVALVLLSIAGCDWLVKKDPPVTAPSCGAPGASVACACVDGRTGAQVCGKDGVFGPCVCSAGVATGPDAGAAPVQVAFDVVLVSAGAGVINVVKVVKTVTGRSLEESKRLVDEAPSTIMSKVDRPTAEAVKAQLVEAGATVEIR